MKASERDLDSQSSSGFGLNPWQSQVSSRLSTLSHLSSTESISAITLLFTITAPCAVIESSTAVNPARS
ncbi:hypothetical protein NC651_019324 [Populus alba x Populus x berolinensis]|nr:hypothetical protein NC651_019324 [Populus alba x Populus x berolinensis]